MTWANLTAEVRAEFASYAGVDFFEQARELVRRHCGGATFRRYPGAEAIQRAALQRTRDWKRRERASNPAFRAREAQHAREYRRRRAEAHAR